MSDKKVFVSGCFDMLHSGHITFLKEAAEYGAVYVCIGSDKTVFDLKGRYPVITEAERKYMLESLKCVHESRISRGSGLLDFIEELDEIRPDIFFVNEDGDSVAKRTLCESKSIQYIVSKRVPFDQLPVRSTTTLRTNCIIPFRIDLAGGWLDQPFVSIHSPGPVLTISIEPVIEFNNRSGMSSSTRNKAKELWKTHIPEGNPEQLAKLLFCFENPPGTLQVAGSQDALGIVLPCLNKLQYDGEYWPSEIQSVHDESILEWLEQHLFLIPLQPRDDSYNVLNNTNIHEAGAKALAVAAETCWNAILQKDASAFGTAFTASFNAQVSMFPHMTNPTINALIEHYKDHCYGYKISGAGGGGYLILFTEHAPENAQTIKIRRKNSF